MAFSLAFGYWLFNLVKQPKKVFGYWLFGWLKSWLLSQNKKAAQSSFLDWLLACLPTNSLANSQQPQLNLPNTFANSWLKQPTLKANTYNQCFQPVKQANQTSQKPTANSRLPNNPKDMEEVYASHILYQRFTHPLRYTYSHHDFAWFAMKSVSTPGTTYKYG